MAAVLIMVLMVMPQAEILSSESRVYSSILSVSQGCCVLKLFLQLAPALAVYHSRASIIAVRPDVTDDRTSVIKIVFTELVLFDIRVNSSR